MTTLATPSVKIAVQPKEKDVLTSFFLAATAASGASIITNPLEVVKTRMQLQNELVEASSKAVERVYKNPFQSLYVIGRQEGLRGLQSGLGMTLAYQFMIAGTRFGLHDPAKRLVGAEKGQNYYWTRLYLAGVLSGAASSFTGNPFYLVRARLQASNSSAVTRGRHQYSSAFEGFKAVYAQDGLQGFFRGIGGAVPRVSFGSATQLTCYEYFKGMLLNQPCPSIYQFNDSTVMLHLSASILTGFFCVTAMNPFDVVSVRLYNQPLDPLTGKGLLYDGPIDCAQKTLAKEGIRGAFKGWTVQYVRLGPHTVFTFLFWEQLKLAYDKVMA
ncbi:solute carrier family 25 member 34 [Thraustotheca clavata]|uniref:Solute carrier family 25 member 34 n=1 Tax=Thraustotheca clavata TaxID=74557 RepID=A0A1W0A3J8_9STRA|nr:solute carrier family 25 member 34 [Thraustotheca clavata]